MTYGAKVGLASADDPGPSRASVPFRVSCEPHTYWAVCLLSDLDGSLRRDRASAEHELLALGLGEAEGRVGSFRDFVGGGREVRARAGRAVAATCEAP